MVIGGNIDSDVLAGVDSEVMLKRPFLYRVILLNDDYTPMDFVISILRIVFLKSSVDAISLMLEVHNRGSAVCGVYSREIAEVKVMHVMSLSRGEGHPLLCRMERDE